MGENSERGIVFYTNFQIRLKRTISVSAMKSVIVSGQRKLGDDLCFRWLGETTILSKVSESSNMVADHREEARTLQQELRVLLVVRDLLAQIANRWNRKSGQVVNANKKWVLVCTR